LFDVGVAGPIAGLVASVIVCVVGLRLSGYVPIAMAADGTISLGTSVAYDALARWVLGPAGANEVLVVHPVAVAGWFGFFITFLNLLPLGQLDGGHLWYALIGRGQWFVGAVALSLLLGMGLYFPGWIVLAVLVALVLRIGHPPVIDETVTLGPGRRLIGLGLIVVFALLFILEPISVQ
jgi:membrane-associated protease RseP (regulator of RpoE activity)